METLADLVARDRRSDRPALRTPSVDATSDYREMDYRRFCTTAWKAGNFLRHLGVGPGHTVAVQADPAPPTVLTFLGAAMLGAQTHITDDPEKVTDSRAVLVHVDRESSVSVEPGTTLVVYGGEPAEATTDYWEGGVWSENPAFPPTSTTGETTALTTKTESWSHANLLSAGRTVATALELDSTDEVELRAPISDPRAVAGGLIAPLLTGGCSKLVAAEEGVIQCDDEEFDLGELEMGSEGVTESQ